MEDTDHSLSPAYRWISVEDRGQVVVVRFIDLDRILGIKDSPWQETYRDFHELANRHRKCLVVLDLQGQSVTIGQESEICISYFVRLFREVKEVQGALKLCNLSRPFQEAMREIRLDRMFSIYGSLGDALASPVLEPE